jgi:hypothetical protein
VTSEATDRQTPWPLPEGLRYLLAWLAALAGCAIALGYAWTSANNPNRRDSNSGHVTIDFGGQWLLARMVATGQGRHLYHHDYLRAAAEAAYPPGDADPEQDGTDAENLLESMVAEKELGTPGRPRVGGPLYPPVQAVLYAPLGFLPPRPAYRVMQLLNLALVLINAWILTRLSGGRVWWPVAVLALLLFPGYGGAINLGQNPPLSLLFLMLGWWQIAWGRPAVGGACWGLLAFKPVWAAAFFPSLLLTRRWRAAAAMALAGAAAVALTLPLVGIGAWFDWLKVGGLASAVYAEDDTWIKLSRDLLGVPRRYRESLGPDLATALGLALLLAVGGCTVLVALRRPRAVRAVTGPGPAFVLLGCWLACYHFMYYDVYLAALPVYLLFTEPARFRTLLGAPWRRVLWEDIPALALALAIALSQVGPLIDKDWEFPPFDTFVLLALWAWCGAQVVREAAVSDASQKRSSQDASAKRR